MDVRATRPDIAISSARSTSAEVLLATIVATWIGFAPLMHGSNSPLAWTINGVVAALLLVLQAVLLAAGRASNRVPMSTYALAAGLYGAAILWMVLQSLPTAFLAHPTLVDAGTGVQLAIAPTIGAAPEAAWWQVLRWSTNAAAFALVVSLAADAGLARRMALIIAGFGAVYALYSLTPINEVWIVFGPKTAYLDSVTGPFINRNSFALYAAAIAILATAILATEVAMLRKATRNRGRAHYSQLFAKPAFLLLTGVLVIALIAIVLTNSRAGFLFGAMALAVVLLLALRRSGGTRLTLITALGGLALAVILLLVLGGDGLLDRFTVVDIEAPLRLDIYADTIAMIADRPLIGQGAGSFEQVFPLFREARPTSYVSFSRAHNLYLEVMSDLGLPMALAALTAVVPILRRTLRSIRNREETMWAPLAAVGAAIAFGLHQMVDFSLQDQANALTFTALLGLGFATATASRDRGERVRVRERVRVSDTDGARHGAEARG